MLSKELRIENPKVCKYERKATGQASYTLAATVRKVVVNRKKAMSFGLGLKKQAGSAVDACRHGRREKGVYTK